jgi:hypothetical protein
MQPWVFVTFTFFDTTLQVFGAGLITVGTAVVVVVLFGLGVVVVVLLGAVDDLALDGTKLNKKH